MSYQICALVIDDNPGDNRILAELLAIQGVATTVITDGTLLHDVIAESAAFDIVFIDLEMPYMDGYEVFDVLANDPRFDGVPLVVTSVHTNEMANVRRIGMNGFLGKPLDPHNFPVQLERLLNGEAVWVR